MSLGILGSIQKTRSLGALVAVAADCWDAPGFKACHTKAWEKARLACLPSSSNPVTGELVWADQTAAGFYRNNPDGTQGQCIEYVDPIFTVDQCSGLCPKKKPKPAPVEPAPAEAPTESSGEVSGQTKLLLLAAGVGALVYFMKGS